jgi:hypothetical protein
VDEYILSAVVAGDEAEALPGVEPLDRTSLLDRHVGGPPVGRRRSKVPTRRCRCGSGAGVHAQNLGDVRSLVSWANADFDGFTRLQGVDAVLSQHTSMGEGVAGPIRESYEAEAFLRAEPLDDAGDRRTGRGLEPGFAEPGSRAECMRLSVLGISVELATPRTTEVLVSHCGFLVVRADELQNLFCRRSADALTR